MRRHAVWLWLPLLLLLPLCAHAQDGEEKSRALLVGVDAFVSRATTYPSSTNNVYAMQEAFQGSKTPFETIYLPDEPVTSGDELRQLIQLTFADAQEGDVSYLYLSTHGVYDPQSGEEPKLLLSDGFVEGSVTPQELEAAFDGIKGTKVLLLDACNSGAFIGKGMVRMPEHVAFLGDDFKVLTSSGAMEESWYWSTGTDTERPQGAFYFTQALSQSLSRRSGYPADINRDGDVTLSELYNYLLQNHAASTPQVYPQQDDFVVFSYDVNERPLPSGRRSAIRDITFSSTTLSAAENSLTLEYIAVRPVRVAYQLVYFRGGKWQFEDAQLLYDNAEQYTAYGDEPGAVSAGRKVRTLSIHLQDEVTSGYVMVQLVTMENGKLTVHAGRVLCVSPAQGMLDLAVETPGEYDIASARELSIFVGYAYPCALSVAVVDENDQIVRRLCHRQSTRPIQTTPQGSTFYWDGMDKNGNPAKPGTYRIRASGVMNELTFTVMSDEIAVR